MLGKLLLLLFILVVAATIVILLWQGAEHTVFSDRQRIVKIGAGVWKVEVADDAWERSQGLSGRDSLSQNGGMLFLFDEPDNYSFWMKGMKFPLDLVWIRDKRVVGVTENVPPANGGNIKFYTPPSPADMVLEINAGSAERFGVDPGDRVIIK